MIATIKARAQNPYIVLAIAIFAATFAAISIRLTQDAGMPSLTIAAGRLLLAALIITPLVWRNHRHEVVQLNRREILMATMGGFWIATHFILLIFALENATVLVVQVLVNTGPIWVALLEVFFLKARLSRVVWLGLFVTIIGGGIIAFSSGASEAGSNPELGNLLAFVGAIAGAIYLTISRSVRQKMSLVPFIWILFGTGGLFASLLVLATGTQVLGLPPMSYFWLLFLTLVVQLIGHSGFNYAIGYFPATFVSLAGQVVSVTSPIVAFFVFREVPGIGEVTGSAIIIAGVAMAILGRSSRKSVGE